MSQTTVTSALPLPRRALAAQVAAAFFSRFVMNVSRRFIYPFAPALSRGLGVPLPAITSLIAVNQFTGLLSPLFGPLSDRWGYRVMMLLGVTMLSVGMFTAGLLPVYGVVVAGVFLAGLSKSLFEPALQAYIGERVPFRRRGLVIGTVELSWAASALLGIPLIGLVIDRLGWRAPFFVLGGLGLISIVVLALIIPNEARSGRPSMSLAQFWQAWKHLAKQRVALGSLAYIFLLGMANDNLFVVYGVWLETGFSLSLVAIGSATVVIGLAELSGSTLTITMADRIGLKRAVTFGAAFVALSYALLPLIAQSLPLALLGLFVIFIGFEFTIVTSLSLFTEVLPAQRATMMSALVAISGLGRVIGAFTGGLLWELGGLPAISIVAALLTLLALAFFRFGLHRWQA